MPGQSYANRRSPRAISPRRTAVDRAHPDRRERVDNGVGVGERRLGARGPQVQRTLVHPDQGSGERSSVRTILWREPRRALALHLLTRLRHETADEAAPQVTELGTGVPGLGDRAQNRAVALPDPEQSAHGGAQGGLRLEVAA